MPAISPKLGEMLLKATGARDIDDAFHKVLSGYLELKLKSLTETIDQFQTKWRMGFDEFRERLGAGTLEKDSYSFNVEKDFWQWEETETLKSHYEALREQWT